ncbi:unnamed protein product [Sphagnum jensenii]|uniref:DUF4371 domain-containing protein n=1 Tax=Sphagnum jensenii TaxID=128206 RepID=A0ABP0VB69_9BRYO
MTDNIHIFKAPFIKEHYLSHLKQHAETWEEYKELSVDSKKVYFNSKVKHANMMHMYIDTNQDAIHFTISLPIGDIIIKELFYRDEDQILAGINEIEEEDEEDHHMNMERIRKKVEKKIVLKRSVMKLFKLDEDNEMYTINIPNSTCFFLAINYVGCGMLFRHITVAIRHAKDRLKMQKLGGINDHNVGQYVRALVATNLNKIVDLLLHPSVWAFLIAGDGNTHRNSSFFDMRIYICVNGILSNLHLVAIPMFKRHIAENIFNLIVRFLDALNDATMIWRAKLMSMSTNGKNRMTGCHRGVVTCLEQAVEFPVLRIWCVPHQIDIVIKNAAALPQDGQWIEVVYKWSFNQECYAGLDENNQKDVVLQISQFVLFIVAGCDRVKAERDGNNNASELDVPLVVPHELVKVVP